MLCFFCLICRFVLNLAISNFLMTVFVMPFVLVSTFTYDWILGDTLCQVTGVLTTLCFVSCILTLLLISGDRYYAIMKPLHYNLNVTSRKASFFICGVWVLSFAVSMMPLIGWNHITYQPAKAMCTVNWRSHKLIDRTYSFFIVFICLVIPYVVMLWVYITVFREAKKTLAKHRKNSVTMYDQQIAPLTSLDDALLSNSPPGGRNGQPSFAPRDLRRKSSVTSLFLAARRRSSTVGRSLLAFHVDDSRAAKTGLIIMFTFTLCWVPFAVLIIFEAVLTNHSADTSKDSVETNSIPTWVESFAVWVALGGCALNPIVYVFRSKSVKREIKYCFCPGLKAEQAEQERRTSLESRGSRRTSIINTSARDSVRSNGKCIRNNSCPTLILQKTGTFQHVNSFPSIASLSGEIV